MTLLFQIPVLANILMDHLLSVFLRKKCPKGSDTWLMIEEVLPQGPVTGTPEDGDFTKDLSSILKNLKRVEQGLDGNFFKYFIYLFFT